MYKRIVENLPDQEGDVSSQVNLSQVNLFNSHEYFEMIIF